jgi:hypothetical protein
MASQVVANCCFKAFPVLKTSQHQPIFAPIQHQEIAAARPSAFSLRFYNQVHLPMADKTESRRDWLVKNSDRFDNT